MKESQKEIAERIDRINQKYREGDEEALRLERKADRSKRFWREVHDWTIFIGVILIVFLVFYIDFYKPPSPLGEPKYGEAISSARCSEIDGEWYRVPADQQPEWCA